MAGQSPAVSYGPEGVSVDVAQFAPQQQSVASKITDAAAKYGVDSHLALSVAHAESGLNPNAKSSKGAVGTMQLMPSTAKSLGVDPHDPDQNIQGGVQYLKQLSDKYNGDQKLIAAAYNAGPGAVDKHGGIPPYPETQAYVQKVTGYSQPSEPPDAAFSKPSGAPPAATAEPSDELFKTAKVAVPGAAPQQAQSPGYQKAYAAFSSTLNKKPDDALGGLAGQFTQGVAYNTLPAIGGITGALSTGLANFLHNNLGVGKSTGFNMQEGYNAARQAQLDKLNGFSQQHPMASLGANVAGFALSPLTKAAIVSAPGKVAGMLPQASSAAGQLVARLGMSAAGAGTAGALAGAGQGVSEGQAPADIAKGAAINAAVSAPFGPAGELASGAGALFNSPAARTLAPVAAHAALGAGAMGLPILASSHNPKLAAEYAGMGAVLGLSGKVNDLKNNAKLPPNITEADRGAALNNIANIVGKGNHEVAASHFENVPEGAHTAVETAHPEQRQQLLQTMGEQHLANLGNIQEQVAARQHPEVVKTRIKSDIQQVNGVHPEETSDFLTKVPHEEAANVSLKANPEQLINNASKSIGESTGIDPRQAEMDYKNYLEEHRNTVSKPLWEAVESTAPVNTPEHNELLANEPIIRQSLARQQKLLGPEASVSNPAYKPSEGAKTPESLAGKDYTDFFAAGKASNRNFNEIKPQEVADFVNERDGHKATQEPETLPTQKAWVYVARDLNGQIARDQFGKPQPDHAVGGSSGYKNSEFVDLAKQVNNLNKEKIPGLAEAKASSGDEFSGAENEGNGFKLGAKGINAESESAFAKRYGSLDEGDKTATQHGYLRHFYQDLAYNPQSAATKYSSEPHKNFQRTMFGADQSNQIQTELKNITDIKQQESKGGPVTNTIGKVQNLIKSGNISDFNHSIETENPDLQHLYRDVYTDHINQKVNEIRNDGGNIEPKHLADLEKLTTSDFHKNAQDKIYGKEQAEQIRGAIQREIVLAKSGKEVTEFKPSQKEEKIHLEPKTSAIFGAVGSMHNLGAMTRGALTGLSAGKIAEAVPFIAKTIMQGDLTPAARRAMGEILSQPPKKVAQDLREAAAKKRNVQMSKSEVKDNLAKRAAIGVGLATGSRTANALSGVDTGQ